MNSSFFTALQTIGTLAGAAAVERLTAHDYIVGSVLGLLCVAAYAAYELIPQKQA